MPLLFLENFASVLKSLHGGLGIISLAALGFGVYLIIRRPNIDWSSGLKASFIGIWSYVGVFVLGLLIYPVFRIRVRADYFDSQLPWLTGLFEIKEYVSAIGLFIALVLLGYFFFLKNIQDSEKPVKQSFINLIFLLFFIDLVSVVVGIVLGLYRSI